MRHVSQAVVILVTSLWIPLAFAQDDPNLPPEPPQAVLQSPPQLDQLVAPIALYPDSLVAQILPAATYPDQILDASKWLDQNRGVDPQQLAQMADSQGWDPSVKALTAFPSVLGNMRQNLAWTSELGDAYVNQPEDVNNAIQEMRRRAQQAGNLQSNPQQNVVTQGQNIEIEPAVPETIYVPAYDPWLAYGDPLAPWPGWYGYPGLYLASPGISFGIGFPIGFYRPYGWGWNHWAYDWHHRGGRIVFDRRPYISHSPAIVRRGNFEAGRRGFVGGSGSFRNNIPRQGFQQPRPGNSFNRPAPNVRPAQPNVPRPNPGMHSGAFSGVRPGGEARGFSNRGAASVGGGQRGGGGRHR
jgi:Protein of unknown function (DUF3300)